MRRACSGSLTVLVLAVLALAGCGGGGEPAASSTPSPTRTTPVPLPIATPTTAVQRCKVTIPDAPLTTLVDAEGRHLAAVTYGSGDAAAVFLHEAGPGGLCGWVPYGAWAGQQGVRAVLLDWCSYGQSHCEGPGASDAVKVLGSVVSAVRAQGARSVTVVGASMGGSLALGAAQAAGADAVVDLSGPATWQGVPAAGEAAAATTIPLLLAIAKDDKEMDPAAVVAAFEASPASPKRLVQPDSGHGWALVASGANPAAPEVTPLGQEVLAWIKGDRAP